MTAPKSQNGSCSIRRRVLSASNAAQPPSRDCMPTVHSVPRAMAASAPGMTAARRCSERMTSAASSTSG